MMIPPKPDPAPPPVDESTWQKPSVYSVAVIAIVFALIGFGLYAGKLTWTESLGAAVIGVLTWVTKGARPPIADKIGGSKPPPPMFPPGTGDSPLPTLTTRITETSDPDRTPQGLPRLARLTGALVIVCGSLVVACPSPFIRPAAYGAELDVCVERAKTKAESQKCREDVARKYGRDAGAGDQ